MEVGLLPVLARFLSALLPLWPFACDSALRFIFQLELLMGVRCMFWKVGKTVRWSVSIIFLGVRTATRGFADCIAKVAALILKRSDPSGKGACTKSRFDSTIRASWWAVY